MNLIEQLREANGFNTGLILSYCASLDWFERLLGQRLAVKGVRRLAILLDAESLSESLDSQLALLQGAGRHYVIQGVKLPGGTFHPKLVLLSGSAGARLYIGSGNLTASGYGRNLEVFERWDSPKENAAVPGVFESVRSYLGEVLGGAIGQQRSDALEEVLDHLFGAAPLAQRPMDARGPVLWSSPGALFDRLRSPKTPATHARFMSPYFDDEGELVRDLASRLRASQFDVITDLSRCNLTRTATENILAAGGRFLATAEDSPLHAKVIHAAGPGWQIGASGSANLTRAAWRGHNAELVVFRHGAQASRIGHLLDECQVREIEDDEWPDVWSRAEEECRAREAKTDPEGPSALSACWRDRQHVQVTVRGPVPQTLGAQWMSASTAGVPQLVRIERDARRPESVLISGAGLERGKAVIAVRLLDGENPGGWIVVHDPEELREAARPPSALEASVDELLSRGEDDLDSVQRVLELFSGILRDRLADGSAGGPRPGHADEVLEEAPPSWLRLREQDFVEPTRTKCGPVERCSSGLPALPVRMMQQLLFGSPHGHEADAAEGESGSDIGDDDERAGQRVQGPHVDASRCKRFLDAARQARELYTRQLIRGGEDPVPLHRLMEDLQVIAAAIHYGVRARAVQASGFLHEMVPVLRTFLGVQHAPFPASLSRARIEGRQDVWERGDPLLLVSLLFYNASLAAMENALDDEPSTLPSMHGLSLWMRHVVRQVPAEQTRRLWNELSRQLPRLKLGALWLGDRWPNAAVALPFPVFLDRLLADVDALLWVERLVAHRLPELAAVPGVLDCADAETPILAAGRDGCVALGFIDTDDDSDHEEGPFRQKAARWRRVAYVHDGAFLQAEAGPHAAFRERMYRLQTNRSAVVPIDLLDELLPDHRAELRVHVEALRRIADD